MTDLTPVLNELLKSHDARPTANPSLSLQHIDAFLTEAYRIVSSHAPDLPQGMLTSSVELTYRITQYLPERHTAGLPLDRAPSPTNI